MLNKTKLTIIVVTAAVLVAGLVAGIIWFAAATRGEQTPSPAPTETAADPLNPPGFTDELRFTAITAAVTVTMFQGSDTSATREEKYVAAGFTQELAENFEPVWFEVFDVATKTHVESTGDTLIGAAVNYTGGNTIREVTATGEPGQRSYQVAIDVRCVPQWSVDGGGSRGSGAFTMPWTVTVDEATGMVTAIEQPAPDELTFQPED